MSDTPDPVKNAAPIFMLQVAAIVIPDDRQREKAEADEALVTSIADRGLINPIIVRNGNVLVAGERRLDAHIKLKRLHIPARNFEDLPLTEAFLIELDENIAREQLSWQEEARAISTFHGMKTAEYAAWTQQGTATAVGMSESSISMRLTVAGELHDPAVSGCQTLSAAHNFIQAKAQRAIAAAKARGFKFADAMAGAFAPLNAETSKEDVTAALISVAKGETELSDIAAPTSKLVEAGKAAAAFLQQAKQEIPSSQLPSGSIINADFLDWAQHYDGIPFDVIHCDFPYGKNYAGANTTNQAEHSQPLYDDSAEVLFKLLAGFHALQDRFIAQEAHCIFWFDGLHRNFIIDSFIKAGWRNCSPNSLIWTKGNSGTPGDYQRTFRHCYETALLFSRGDRKLVKLVQDHFPHPIDEEKLHLSQKPVPMLKHFLGGICDEHSRVLDPTCGSGSAIAAANLLQVDYAVGIELDPSNAQIAQILVERKVAEGGGDATA